MRTTRHTRGFTLIELLVVITIIGLLAGAGLGGLNQVRNYAMRVRARNDIQNLETALRMYKDDVGVYPNDSDPVRVINDLTGYRTYEDRPDPIYLNDPNWRRGPYFQADERQFDGGRNGALLDPWGEPYHFRLQNPQHNHFSVDIWSSGPNRINEEGKGDDITNW